MDLAYIKYKQFISNLKKLLLKLEYVLLYNI